MLVDVVVVVVDVGAVEVGAGFLLFFDGGGFGFVPIVSMADVAVVDVVSLFVAGGCPFFGIGVFGMRAGGGAFGGAAVDGAAVAEVSVTIVDDVGDLAELADGAVDVVTGSVAVVVVGSMVATVAVVADDSVTVVVFVVSVWRQAAIKKMSRMIVFFMTIPFRSSGR